MRSSRGAVLSLYLSVFAFAFFCLCLCLLFLCLLLSLSPGRPADNGRVQGGKQGGPKNCAGAVDTDAGKRWKVRTKNGKIVQEQKIMKTTIFMLRSLASCTTCRLFRSRSLKTTDGSTRIGRNTPEGFCGGGRWREPSKRLTGTFHQKSFDGQFLWLLKERITSIPSHAK